MFQFKDAASRVESTNSHRPRRQQGCATHFPQNERTSQLPSTQEHGAVPRALDGQGNDQEQAQRGDKLGAKRDTAKTIPVDGTGSDPRTQSIPGSAQSKDHGCQATPPFTAAHVCTGPRSGEDGVCRYTRAAVSGRIPKCAIREEPGPVVWLSECVAGDPSLGKTRQRQE